MMLVKVTITDEWFKKGEVFWIEWDKSREAYVNVHETNSRLAGSSLKYTTYRTVTQEEYPEEFL